MLGNYTRVDHFNIANKNNSQNFNKLKEQLGIYDLIIISVHRMNNTRSSDYGITTQVRKFINSIQKHKNTIVTVFGNPYSLDKFDKINESGGLIMAYQEGESFQKMAAQLIFGGIGSSGKLPVSIDEDFKAGDGISISSKIRFSYVMPEELNIDSEVLKKKINDIANLALEKETCPGLQVLAAKNGKIFFHETWGYHTYEQIHPVKKYDIYDLASVTKISGPLPALMKLNGEGKFDLDSKFSDYWPDFKRSNKKNIMVRETLAHNARLLAWIPYWKSTKRKNGKFKWFTIKPDSSKRYPIKLTDDLFLHKNYKNKIYKAIRKTALNEKKEYLYSGLPFYLFPD